MKRFTIRWLKHKQYYTSLIVQDCLCIILLKKVSSTYELVASEYISFENAGIVDGHLGNPSFFAYVLYNFFEKYQVKYPHVSLLISGNGLADRLQYELYFEFFKIPLINVVAKIIDKHTAYKFDESCVKQDYMSHAIALWQEESYAKR